MFRSITVQLCSLLFALLLTIAYFAKKRLNSKENKVYAVLIHATWMTIILDILRIAGIYYEWSSLIIRVLIALFMSGVLVWTWTFTIYIFFISYNKENKSEEENKCYYRVTALVFYSACILSIALMFILPSHPVKIGDLVYCNNGANGNFYFILSIILMIVWIIKLALNVRHVIELKNMPIFVYILLDFVIIIMQMMSPDLKLLSLLQIFVTFLMFFTIENPDMKLINALASAKDEAVQANDAKSDFLSSMSHEIRTPLNAIVCFSQNITEVDNLEEAKEEARDVVVAANSLLEIVNSILDISKIEANKLDIVNIDYNSRELFDNIIVLTKGRLCAEKPIEFKTTIDEKIPSMLYGDSTRLKQVVLNFLTNAVKYTEKGFIDFRVCSEIVEDMCHLTISIEDSGMGIKEEDLCKLFAKFERLDLKKTNAIEGTGLGLSIAKNLIELMHGEVQVESEYGKGSTFTITINQKISTSPLIQKPEEKAIFYEDFDYSDKKVLVVDDNRLNIKVALMLLKKYKNLKIVAVESGQECLDEIEKENYDLIFLDDMMPNMSGAVTFSKLKEDPNFKTPVIALTANAIVGVREKYLEQGFDEYLSKPIDKLELDKIVKTYLN